MLKIESDIPIQIYETKKIADFAVSICTEFNVLNSYPDKDIIFVHIKHIKSIFTRANIHKMNHLFNEMCMDLYQIKVHINTGASAHTI